VYNFVISVLIACLALGITLYFGGVTEKQGIESLRLSNESIKQAKILADQHVVIVDFDTLLKENQRVIRELENQVKLMSAQLDMANGENSSNERVNKIKFVISANKLHYMCAGLKIKNYADYSKSEIDRFLDKFNGVLMEFSANQFIFHDSILVRKWSEAYYLICEYKNKKASAEQLEILKDQLKKNDIKSGSELLPPMWLKCYLSLIDLNTYIGKMKISSMTYAGYPKEGK
jgi:hypothetical protein